jgi:hypothetical protein
MNYARHSDNHFAGEVTSQATIYQRFSVKIGG